MATARKRPPKTAPRVDARKPGRPEREDKASVQDAFVAAIRDGGTTRSACAAANVAWGSLCRWLADDDAFAARYARAREDAGHMWADKAVSVLEELPKDASKEAVATARARADIYKWRAVVQGRRDYGERSVVENEGAVTLNVVVRNE